MALTQEKAMAVVFPSPLGICTLPAPPRDPPSSFAPPPSTSNVPSPPTKHDRNVVEVFPNRSIQAPPRSAIKSHTFNSISPQSIHVLFC